MGRSDKGTLLLRAPVTGVMVPLTSVPDPVFAEKMVGDGFSIDPLNELLVAPCDGEVTYVHGSSHAVTIKSYEGVEVVLHIGLETVSLKGDGFITLVELGDTVTTGQPLIQFDADFIATNAKSLLTQVVVTDMDKVVSIDAESGHVYSGDTACSVTLKVDSDKSGELLQEGKVTSDEIALVNPTGLHARPSAVLASLAKQYESEIELVLGDRRANAKSITSILKLDTKLGDKVILTASGGDAEKAIREITREIMTGLGDEGCVIKLSPASESVKITNVSRSNSNESDLETIRGVSASTGIAMGTVFKLQNDDIAVKEVEGSSAVEYKRFQEAIEKGHSQLEALRARLHTEGEIEKSAIFAAHIELLSDPDLISVVEELIAKGKSAPFSWKEGYTKQAEELAALGSAVLAERANDMTDVGSRILGILLGVEMKEPEFPEGCILVAEDLTPSITANLDPKKVKGICTTGGGATSHVAILARAKKIPAIAGTDPRILEIENGTLIVMNGTKGTIKTNPDQEYVEQISKVQHQIAERHAVELSESVKPAITADGVSIEVVGNVGKPEESKEIVILGGEGVGLLRSEFLFLERRTAPTEDEQYEAYKRVLETMGADAKVIIRTLDVGGDKPLPYMPLPSEENPFLGERGIRIGLNRPEMLRTQLRALLRASEAGNLHIMFPMVGLIEEWYEAKAILDEERENLGVPEVPVGIMIEVPSAALLADVFAEEVDFFSIGTNDLTQYTLAMDRGHPLLASKQDGLHPSVLQLIKTTVDAAHKHGKWVGVCGGLASDSQAVPILVGLGVDELSLSIPSIPSVKAQIRSLTKKECEELANSALTARSASKVREISKDPYALELEILGE